MSDYKFIIQVRFKSTKKSYSFGTNVEIWTEGDYAVVESLHGLELARVVTMARPIGEVEVNDDLKGIVRKASPKDVDTDLENIKHSKEAWTVCQKIIKKLNLNMNLIDASYNLDRSKILFVYVSEERVDFRELLKELSSALRCRIELRQVGPRDKAKMVGGLGTCGNETCCSRFMKDFDVISINMAKNQLLALNIQKLSGQCGKLMCCLKNEDDIYSELRKGLPKLNAQIKYKDKKFRMTGLNLLTNQVKLDSRDEIIMITVDDLREILKEYSDVKVVENNDQETTKLPK